jgi:hypothetical protein
MVIFMFGMELHGQALDRLLDQQELKVQRGLKDQQVAMVLKVQKDHKVSRVLKEQKVHKDQRVHRAQLAMMVNKV